MAASKLQQNRQNKNQHFWGNFRQTSNSLGNWIILVFTFQAGTCSFTVYYHQKITKQIILHTLLVIFMLKYFISHSALQNFTHPTVPVTAFVLFGHRGHKAPRGSVGFLSPGQCPVELEVTIWFGCSVLSHWIIISGMHLKLQVDLVFLQIILHKSSFGLSH